MKVKETVKKIPGWTCMLAGGLVVVILSTIAWRTGYVHENPQKPIQESPTNYHTEPRLQHNNDSMVPPDEDATVETLDDFGFTEHTSEHADDREFLLSES